MGRDEWPSDSKIDGVIGYSVNVGSREGSVKSTPGCPQTNGSEPAAGAAASRLLSAVPARPPHPLRALALDPVGRSVLGTFLVTSVVFGSWVSRVADVQAQVGIGVGALGLALLGLPLGALVASLVGGWVVETVGAGRVLLWAGLGLGPSVVLPALAVGPTTLGAGAFAYGLIGAWVGVGMNTAAATAEGRLGRRVIAACHGVFSVGAAAGAALGTFAATAGLTPPVHLALVAVAGGVAVFALRSGYRRLARTGTAAAARPPLFALPRPPLVGLAVVGACVLAGESAVADWGAVYLRDTFQDHADLGGLGYAAFASAMAAGRLLGDPVAERLGAAAVVRRGAALAAVGLTAVVVSPSPWLALGGFALVGVGFSGALPAVYAAAATARGVAPGVGVAVVGSASLVGVVAQPPLVGAVAEAAGLRVALASLAALAALAAALAPRAFRRAARTETA